MHQESSKVLFLIAFLPFRDASPGSQLVIDEWKMDFNTYMSSGLSYVVLEIDGIGSAGQGQEKIMNVMNKLGQLEVQDQLDATRFEFLQQMGSPLFARSSSASRELKQLGIRPMKFTI